MVLSDFVANFGMVTLPITDHTGTANFPLLVVQYDPNIDQLDPTYKAKPKGIRGFLSLPDPIQAEEDSP
jgi:hypothetical protein